MVMRNSLRLSSTLALAFAAAACSRSSASPAMSDDLKKDLAQVGGGDVQLAGASTPRLDVVSASERTMSPVPAPKAPQRSKAPSAFHGSSAPVASVRHQTPAPVQAAPVAEQTLPAEQPRIEPIPQPVPSAGRPQAPLPSTQREPRGGWKTPGQVIRNAPFPINP